MSTDNRAILAYAATPQSRWMKFQRRIYQLRRWLIAITVLGVLAAFGPDLYRGLRQHYYRRQMLSYVDPPDRVTCSESASWGGNVGGFVAVASDPPCVLRAGDVDPARIAVPPSLAEPTLFLHARTTQGGLTRLVHIRRRPPTRRESWDAPIGFSITLTTPRLLPFQQWPAIEQSHEEVIPQVYDADAMKSAIRILAGQPVDNDASRFTIPYVVEDMPGVIEGRLLDPPPGETEPRVVLKRKS